MKHGLHKSTTPLQEPLSWREVAVEKAERTLCVVVAATEELAEQTKFAAQRRIRLDRLAAQRDGLMR